MKTIFYTSSLALLLIFSGCKNSQVLKCPDVASAKPHHVIWAKQGYTKQHSTATVKRAEPKVTVADQKTTTTATASNEISAYQVKIPKLATGKLNEDELKGLNDVFVKYSDSKVQLERNEKGKLYLKAHAATDIFKLAKTLIALKKTGPAAIPAGDGSAIALAGGIIGIVAIVLALGPYVSYGAFLLGIIAIILGAIGLHSSRRGWAIAGIVLGVLAILFAGVLGIGIYTIVLHI